MKRRGFFQAAFATLAGLFAWHGNRVGSLAASTADCEDAGAGGAVYGKLPAWKAGDVLDHQRFNRMQERIELAIRLAGRKAER